MSSPENLDINIVYKRFDDTMLYVNGMLIATSSSIMSNNSSNDLLELFKRWKSWNDAGYI